MSLQSPFGEGKGQWFFSNILTFFLFRKLRGLGVVSPRTTYTLRGQVKNQMHLILFSASRTQEEQRELGESWRGSQKDGLGWGERLVRALAISPSISITACVQIDPFCVRTLARGGGGSWGEVVSTRQLASMSNHKWHSMTEQSLGWDPGIQNLVLTTLWTAE